VAALHEPAYETVAHAPQSDHPELHVCLLSMRDTLPARRVVVNSVVSSCFAPRWTSR
jgi:hypothetical protein